MKKIFALFFIFMILGLISCKSVAINKNNVKFDIVNSDNLIILDTTTIGDLPKNFRIIKNLSISGSAQFVPSQIGNMIKAISNKNIHIIDLREESHGFVNNEAVSLYNQEKVINNGFTLEEVTRAENDFLKSITINKDLNIYSKHGKKLKTILVEETSNEFKTLQSKGIYYLRIPVRDSHIPSPKDVDDFLKIVKNKPDRDHLHFHCEHGDGRTTTFMAMYEMMKNNSNESLEVILDNQIKAGGVLLTDSITRAEFLKNFYNYTLENKKSGFMKSYSSWIKNN